MATEAEVGAEWCGLAKDAESRLASACMWARESPLIPLMRAGYDGMYVDDWLYRPAGCIVQTCILAWKHLNRPAVALEYVAVARWCDRGPCNLLGYQDPADDVQSIYLLGGGDLEHWANACREIQERQASIRWHYSEMVRLTSELPYVGITDVATPMIGRRRRKRLEDRQHV